jgi:hypothetical protein
LHIATGDRTKDTIRLKTHIKTELLKRNDDANKAIDMLIEENKTLNTKVSTLQNVTFSASKPLQTATSGFGTGLTYSSTSSVPSTSFAPQSVFIDSDWKKMKTIVESALEPYVGRQ